MRVFSANRFRTLVLISEIAAAEKDSTRKARHWPARRSSAGSVEGVRGLFRQRSLLGEDLESTFSCRIAPPVVQFFRNDASEWTGRRRRLPGRTASSSSRSDSTFNPLRNLHSRKEKAFGFCCAGLGFRCAGLGFRCGGLGFWCLRLGNPSFPASRPSAASPWLDKGGFAIHIPSTEHPHGCRKFRNLAIAEAAR